MEPRHRNAVLQCWKSLQELLDVHHINNYLLANSIFTFEDYGLVNNEPTEERQRIQLLQIVLKRTQAWPILIDALNNAGQQSLANQLVAALNDASDHRKIEENHHVTEELKLCIREDCEHVREVWADYLLVSDMNKIFKAVEVVETNGSRIRSEIISTYDYLAVTGRRTFIAEGDPGSGKTTANFLNMR